MNTSSWFDPTAIIAALVLSALMLFVATQTRDNMAVFTILFIAAIAINAGVQVFLRRDSKRQVDILKKDVVQLQKDVDVLKQAAGQNATPAS